MKSEKLKLKELTKKQLNVIKGGGGTGTPPTPPYPDPYDGDE